VAGSSQACALGSAVAAAVVAGVYQDYPSAQKAMTSLKPVVYRPQPANRCVYDKLYRLYRQLHDAFGGVERKADLGPVMKELLSIKQNTRS
jgi:L-ribulokinase